MTIGLVTALAKDHKPDDIIAILYRLGALAKLIEEGHAGKWAISRSPRRLPDQGIERRACFSLSDTSENDATFAFGWPGITSSILDTKKRALGQIDLF